jgi:hypothetical protein
MNDPATHVGDHPIALRAVRPVFWIDGRVAKPKTPRYAVKQFRLIQPRSCAACG